MGNANLRGCPPPRRDIPGWLGAPPCIGETVLPPVDDSWTLDPSTPVRQIVQSRLEPHRRGPRHGTTFDTTPIPFDSHARIEVHPRKFTGSSARNLADSQPRKLAMQILLVFASLLAAVYATALTYRLEAHEKACFFAQVADKGTKVAFYFAVGFTLSLGGIGYFQEMRTGKWICA